MSEWPHQSEVDAYYGNPRGKNGEADVRWVDENIVGVSPPWELVNAWDLMSVRSIR